MKVSAVFIAGLSATAFALPQQQQHQEQAIEKRNFEEPSGNWFHYAPPPPNPIASEIEAEIASEISKIDSELHIPTAFPTWGFPTPTPATTTNHWAFPSWAPHPTTFTTTTSSPAPIMTMGPKVNIARRGPVDGIVIDALAGL